MQKVIMFHFKSCPHCQNAQRIIEELCEANPAYRSVEIERIDEKLQPEVAECYDYYYVPTFFVGTEKLHEGVPTREAIQKVLECALKK